MSFGIEKGDVFGYWNMLVRASDTFSHLCEAIFWPHTLKKWSIFGEIRENHENFQNHQKIAFPSL